MQSVLSMPTRINTTTTRGTLDEKGKKIKSHLYYVDGHSEKKEKEIAKNHHPILKLKYAFFFLNRKK